MWRGISHTVSFKIGAMSKNSHNIISEKETPEGKNITRRQFLKVGVAAVAATALATACGRKQPESSEAAALGEVPEGKMTYRTNAKGDKVSLLGYGSMRLPIVNGGSARETEGEIDVAAVKEQIAYAFAHGLNMIDTAPPYCKGRSEKVMGEVLADYPRSSYYLSTKLSNFTPDTWSLEASKAIYYNSLKSLRTEYLDFLLMHSCGNSGRDLEGNELDGMQVFERRFLKNGLLDFLLEERAAGRIRNLGFSYHGDVRVFDWLLSKHDIYKWDVALIQHNYVDWRHAHEINPRNTNSEYLYGELSKRGIPAFVMEPLLGGRLAQVNEFAMGQMKSRDPQASAASWAFRFAGNLPGVLSVFSGMTYMEHLQDNLRTYSPLRPLSDDELAMLSDIATVFARFPEIPCTHCEYCMPCPYGLDIPEIFSHYNKSLRDGNVVADTGSASYRRARRAFLVGYGRKVPVMRQADYCIRCGVCLSHCPQNIDIPSEMGRIGGFTEELKKQMI